MARCIARRLVTDPDTNRLTYVQCRHHARGLVNERYPFCIHHLGALTLYGRIFIVGDMEVMFVAGEAFRLTGRQFDVTQIEPDHPEFDPTTIQAEAGINGT